MPIPLFSTLLDPGKESLGVSSIFPLAFHPSFIYTSPMDETGVRRRNTNPGRIEMKDGETLKCECWDQACHGDRETDSACGLPSVGILYRVDEEARLRDALRSATEARLEAQAKKDEAAKVERMALSALDAFRKENRKAVAS
jgi:hypothetical protein